MLIKDNKSSCVVSIACFVYNHENTISQTLDSFLTQKVNFKFEIVIHDDASTDDSLVIINKYKDQYPDIIKVIAQKENVFRKGISKIWTSGCLDACQGTYIAVCEGDDYWVNDNKLQIQFDFLENNSDFGICWTNFNVLKNNSLVCSEFSTLISSDKVLTYDTVFENYCTYTLTCMFRKALVSNESIDSFKFFKDNSLYLLVLSKSKGMYLNTITAVYRIHEQGIYSMQSVFFKHYSSFVNLTEALQLLGLSKTNKKVLQNLLYYAVKEVVLMYKQDKRLGLEHKQAVKAFLFKSRFSQKIKVLKQVFNI